MEAASSQFLFLLHSSLLSIRAGTISLHKCIGFGQAFQVLGGFLRGPRPIGVSEINRVDAKLLPR